MADRRRLLACLTTVLLAGATVSTRQERPLDPAALQDFVHAERRAQQLPGLAAVVVRSGGTPQVYVSGERWIGKGDPMTTADRMHLGSVTKSITATLIGALAEKGVMTLDTTIGQAFPELSPRMQPPTGR